MKRLMFRSKIHRATVTEANLNYKGSVTIDETLLERAKIFPYEQVQIVNINNGQRFETYCITGKRDSGVICLNGAAARLVHPGDLVIILTYTWMSEKKAKGWQPVIVHVNEKNQIVD